MKMELLNILTIKILIKNRYLLKRIYKHILFWKSLYFQFKFFLTFQTMKKQTKKIDLFDLFSKDERDYLSQQICEKLTDNGLNPDDVEIIFEGDFIDG